MRACARAVALTLAVSMMVRESSTAWVTDFMQPMGNDTHSREESHDPNVACQGGEKFGIRNGSCMSHDENTKIKRLHHGNMAVNTRRTYSSSVDSATVNSEETATYATTIVLNTSSTNSTDTEIRVQNFMYSTPSNPM